MSSTSPNASTHSFDARNNPRRRQRQSEDGVSLRQQPLRKRSKVTRDVFRPLDNNGTANGGHGSGKLMNGHVPSPARSESPASAQLLDMPYRSQKKNATGAKVGSRDDETTTLTSNAQYTVKQLPGLPKQIRSNRSSYRGSRINLNGYALTVTKDEALIWDYTTPASTPTTQALVLPHPARADDPLPLAAFVTSGSGSDTGLVVVNATNGKVSFWESIENADALSLFEQRRNGVEGSCGSLAYGETVTGIEDADSAGFVVSFSSGRAAQLLVRDSQSRPAISVNFLRNPKGASAGGIFGSLKSVFGGGGWLPSVAAVRTRPASSRGQTDALVASEDVTFQSWQLNWSGQTVLHREIHARSAVQEAVAAIHGPDEQGQALGVKLLDFAFASNDLNYLDLWLLICFGTGSTQNFALAKLEIGDDDTPTARGILSLHSYTASLAPKSNWKPKLCLPNTGLTAFVVFEKAITIVSLGTSVSGAHSRLLTNAQELPDEFQDTVYLRDDNDYFSCGAMAERARGAQVIVFVQGYGVLRVAASSPSASGEGVRITAKSKIEQAVFFGYQSSNPLNLMRKPETKFELEEVEHAALDISERILATDSPYISALASSMERHLEQRANYLRYLASYVHLFYPEISRLAKWQLRWNGEKMAAAQKVWSLCDRRRTRGDREMRLLSEMLISIAREFKTDLNTERGETDRTRHFFLRDVANIYVLLAWPYKQLQDLQGLGEVRDSDKYLELLSEANDIVLGGLNAAFNYRAEHAELYGLAQEPTKEGLLDHGYEGLPEFWTSDRAIISMMPGQIEANRRAIDESIDENNQGFLCTVADLPADIQKLTHDMVKLVDLYCKTGEEKCRIYQSVAEGMEPNPKNKFIDAYKSTRLKMLNIISDALFELQNNGFALAEKYSDMEGLVKVVSLKSDLIENVRSSGKGADVAAWVSAENKSLEERTRGYLAKYGSTFADIMFTQSLQTGQLNTFLGQAKTYPEYLTTYLRSHPGAKKVAWINEALFEQNHFRAGQDLMDVAVSQETGLWSKKVELSIAKLALISAETEEAKLDEERLRAARSEQADAVRVVKIQEKVYAHIRPKLYDAVDESAEVQLAMEAFGRVTVHGRPRLEKLLESGMEKLVGHAAMGADQLIDILTLMDQHECEFRADDICGQESLLALEALKYGGLGDGGQRFELYLRIIWRRCFLRDDWDAINNTARKSDDDVRDDLISTTLFKTVYEGFARGLWDPSSTGMRMLSPADVLGAGTSTEEHNVRFSSPDLSEPIAKETAKENEELEALVQQSRLEHWFGAAREMAEQLWSEEKETREDLAQKLGSATRAIYDEDADLKRGGEQTGMSIPGTWREAVRMGLGMFRLGG